MLRFFLVFVFIQVMLFSTELLQPVQAALVIPWTEGVAALSTWLIQTFDSRVLVEGVVIRSLDSGFAVEIRAGCNGVEASIILAAAIFAFPHAPLQHKLTGFLLGFSTVQLLNLLRIISLFYIGQWNKSLFDWAHLYLWEVLIMLDVLIIFLLWISYLPRPAVLVPPQPSNG